MQRELLWGLRVPDETSDRTCRIIPILLSKMSGIDCMNTCSVLPADTQSNGLLLVV